MGKTRTVFGLAVDHERNLSSRVDLGAESLIDLPPSGAPAAVVWLAEEAEPIKDIFRKEWNGIERNSERVHRIEH